MNPTDVLGAEFWTWRSAQQPRSSDDIPRIDRPNGWLPRWSAADVEGYRADLARFEQRLAGLAPADDRAETVDRRLLASALARVRWELDILRPWQSQPRFYVDQTIGAVFDVLVRPDPDAVRLDVVASLLEATSDVLADGRANLTGHAVAEFARAAIDELARIDEQVEAMVGALCELPAARERTDRLERAGGSAGPALAEFREWLADHVAMMGPVRPVGRDGYQWFLTEVAVMPFSPDDIRTIGSLELDRAITLEALEQRRTARADRQSRATTSTPEQQSAAEAAAELQVRAFYVDHGLLSQPDSMRHYLNAPLPDHLAPISWLGVTDDLTGPDRLAEDGYSYVHRFDGEMPYFYAANAEDPRAGIVHEGAHYQQLTRSWGHERPMRRHYYDSGPNEGIAFYNEELMLAAGLFDDAPRTRQIIYNFMRLRALRVEVDVRLAIGDLDIPAAAAYLEDVVPMDAATAREEAAFFASCPGQALTYQIGKTQILSLFADAVRALGPDFDLQRFHDRLWIEGNVPLALQRWELLDDDSDLNRVDRLRDGTDFGGRHE